MSDRLLTAEEIFARFDHHPPDGQRVALHEWAREHFKGLAIGVNALPGGPSRERSLAQTALQEAMFWTNAHIAQNVEDADKP